VKDALGAVQRILVLGGGSDIGQAIAARLASARGAGIVLAGRDVDSSDLAARTSSDVAVEWFDARATGEHAALLDDVWARHDGFDVVVVAFGVQGEQALAERDTAHALAIAIAETNYLGAMSASLEAGRRLRQQGHGALVVLSSVAAERTRRSLFVYASSKAGIDSFALGLADALRPDGVHVLVVRPGFVRTKLTAGLRTPPFATTPDAVAEVVAGGLARGARIVWCPPLMRWVMVVLRHLPHAVFSRLPI
jgi:decaprenylphospho-beta-D-erythro-pentofuranosid-2-ulose 2-reductase